MRVKISPLLSGVLLMAIIGTALHSQPSNSSKWPIAVVHHRISSSSDQETQDVLYYAPPTKEPRPLIVSLHTWSGDYTQFDPLIIDVMEKGYHYIHPNFRGANKRPEACGSEWVVPEIEDAIQFAIDQGGVDTSEIHIIGVSGGGHAALLCYTRMKFAVKSISAWVPVTNIEDWYWECKSRQLPYAKQIWELTNSVDSLNSTEARLRSPVFDSLRSDGTTYPQLFMYAGVHDGYTGSIPVSQSVQFYNKLVRHFDGSDSDNAVTDSQLIALLAKRSYPGENHGYIGSRKLHFFRQFHNLSLSLFEGTHEQLENVALHLIPIANQPKGLSGSVLVIGASNETAQDSWTRKLAVQFSHGNLVCYATPGNTMGYDNLGNPALNTLRNMDSLLTFAYEKNDSRPFDFIITALGTNDCKAVFQGDTEAMEAHFQALIQRLSDSPLFQQGQTHFIFLSPPPVEEAFAEEKYKGGEACVLDWKGKLYRLAPSWNATFVDIHDLLKNRDGRITKDGVHLSSFSQAIVAKHLNLLLRKYLN